MKATDKLEELVDCGDRIWRFSTTNSEASYWARSSQPVVDWTILLKMYRHDGLDLTDLALDSFYKRRGFLLLAERSPPLQEQMLCMKLVISVLLSQFFGNSRKCQIADHLGRLMVCSESSTHFG
jgi:hypothetical protein